MQSQSQANGQKDFQKQTSASNRKPEEKIYNAFANILMKYQLRKTHDSQSSKDQHNLAQSSVIVLDHEETKAAEENVSESLSKGAKIDSKMQEERPFNKIMQKFSQNKNNQTTEAAVNQKPKNSMKKSSKNKFQNQQIFTSHQKKQLFQSNPLKQFLKSKGNKTDLKKNKISKDKGKELQYVVQESQVEEINETTKLNGKIGRVNGKKGKISKQKISSQGQFIQIKPQIVVREDEKIVQLLKKKQPSQKNAISPRMKTLNFVIKVTLLPNKDIGIDLKKSKIRNYIQNMKKSNVNKSLSKSCVNFKNINNQAKDSLKTIKQQKNKSGINFQKKLSKNKEIYEQVQEQKLELVSTKQKLFSLKNNLVQEKSQPNDKKLKKSRVQSKSNMNSQREPYALSKSMAKPSKKQLLSKSAVGPAKNNGPINLGHASLQDIVDQLFKKQLISQSERNQFIKNHSQSTVKEYLNKFQQGKLHKFNYVKVQFTLLDHRRLSELLVKLFPQKYIVKGCIHKDPQTQKFLADLYDITIEDYQKLCSRIDKISKISWWSKMQQQSQKMMEIQNSQKNSKKKLGLSYSALKQSDQRNRVKSALPEKNKSKLKSKVQFTSIFDKELTKLYQSAVNEKSSSRGKNMETEEKKSALKTNRIEEQGQSYKINSKTRSLRKNKLS